MREMERLREIKAEIEFCFNGWDIAIRNGQQPVSIQDLDYWYKELKAVIMLLENSGV